MWRGTCVESIDAPQLEYYYGYENDKVITT